MGSIFAFGTGFAAPTGASAHSIKRILAAAGTSLALSAAAPTAEVDVQVEKLRSDRGTVHLCLTRDRARFPNCRGDPAAMRLSARAGEAAHLHLSGVAPGRYALSVIHDENRNGKLDTLVRIPREGFGFSRNPQIRFGPPSFEQVQFDVRGGTVSQTVVMRYLL